MAQESQLEPCSPIRFTLCEQKRIRAKSPENGEFRRRRFACVRCCSVGSVTAKWPQRQRCGRFAGRKARGRAARHEARPARDFAVFPAFGSRSLFDDSVAGD